MIRTNGNNLKIHINKNFYIIVAFFIATVLSCISTINLAGGLTKLIFPNSQYKISQQAFVPDKGVHGVWVTTVYNNDFPSKQGLSTDEQKKEADKILDKVVDMGLNTVFFQVRSNSDALYKSSIYPWSAVLTGTQGKDPGYDPLEYFVEGAHKRGLKLHAWVNPYRVQSKTDRTLLCDTQPALKHPEWTVETKKGQLYYDPGNSEVRKCIENGIEEIVKNYKVDGIVFDDYFYPEKDFNDKNTYKLNCTNGQTIEDFRRNSVNLLVKETHEKIKAINKDVKFGISPAGVWANSSQTILGSNTKGAFSSYYEQYADTRLWVKSNWVDYISPQLYWAIGNEKADYAEVLDWWVNTVKGTKVDLYISHGALYQNEGKNDWGSPDQILKQVRMASKYPEYKGSIYFSYSDLVKDNKGFATALKNYYNGKVMASSFGRSLEITSPADGTTTSESRVRITGVSDYNFPLLLNGTPVERSEDGYFSVYVNLVAGKNEFAFEHKGDTKKLTINSAVDVLTSVNPKQDIIADGGAKINISAVAHKDATVYATIANQKIKMSEVDTSGIDNHVQENNSSSDYVTFSGIFTLPESGAEEQDLGNISVTASYANLTKSLEGSHVKVKALKINKGEKCIATVVSNSSINNQYVETFLYADNLYRPVACSQIPGTWDYLEANADGTPKQYYYDSMSYYRLSCGLMLYSGNVKISSVKEMPLNEISKVTQSSEDNSRYTTFTFDGTTKVTYNAGTTVNYPNMSTNATGMRDYSISNFNAKEFVLYVFNTKNAVNFDLQDNPLFNSVSVSKISDTSFKYTFTLKKPGSFYGFDVTYNASGDLVLSCKNPWNGDVNNLKVAIDPGHGGVDFGAVAGKNYEKTINLEFAKKVKQILIDKYKLKEENIFITRTEDKLIAEDKGKDLQKRIIDTINTHADVSICIHQNDGGGEGFETYYYQPFSHDLAATIQSNLSLAYSTSGFKAVNRGCKFTKDKAYYTTRQSQFPSILVECGFIDNSNDVKFITSDKGKDAICDALAKSCIEAAKAR